MYTTCRVGVLSSEISKHSKISPPPSLRSHLTSSPMGVFSGDYGTSSETQTMPYSQLTQLGERHTNALTVSVLLHPTPAPGTTSEFKRRFETPILRSRDSCATDKETQRGEEKLSELASIVNRSAAAATSTSVCKGVCVLSDVTIARYYHFTDTCMATRVYMVSGRS